MVERGGPAGALVDMLVVGPGEEALEAILSGRAPGTIPNLVVHGEWPASTWQGSASRGPTPDFEGLQLDEYLSPKVVFPLAATRGCYWNRCTFCNLPVHGPTYEYRGSARLAADMEALSATRGARFFDLTGEVVPLGSLIGLSKEVARSGLHVRWQTQTRLDRGLSGSEARTLRAGGCARLMFGLESGCERVLGLMDKGTALRRARQVLARTREAGIALTLHFSPTLCCIAGYDGACCVTLGRPPQRISLDTPPVASVASLASTALSAASRRQSVRNAGYGLLPHWVSR